jgi:nicotinate-nucleotide adenylyltransferase
MTSRTVAVFGGSFNPPHVGHVLAGAYVLAVHDVDGLLVVPAFRHPFNKELCAFEHRAAMARLAFRDLARTEVSEIERELALPVSRTVDTLEALRVRHPDWRLRLVIGADVLHDRDKWHRFDRVVELAPPIVLGRAGVEHPEAPPAVLPEVSSSAVRAALATSDEARVALLVPHPVRDYVARERLYGAR